MGQRAKFGLAINELVRSGEISAPIVIGRDHLDTGSVASPYRETEGMLDGSDAIADWPLLNALVNTAAGASWVSIHNGGGVGIGYSQHAGMVVVADGTDEAARRLERVLTTDPGMGVLRHVDAGYAIAERVRRERNSPSANAGRRMTLGSSHRRVRAASGELLAAGDAGRACSSASRPEMRELAIISDGAMLVRAGRIAAVGARSRLSRSQAQMRRLSMARVGWSLRDLWMPTPT